MMIHVTAFERVKVLLTTCSNQPDEEEDIQVDLDEEDVDFD